MYIDKEEKSNWKKWSKFCMLSEWGSGPPKAALPKQPRGLLIRIFLVHNRRKNDRLSKWTAQLRRIQNQTLQKQRPPQRHSGESQEHDHIPDENDRAPF